MSTFTVKETFPDITRSELMLLNKGLKQEAALHDLEVIKAVLPGEKWPSNHWPICLEGCARGLLEGIREGKSEQQILTGLRHM